MPRSKTASYLAALIATLLSAPLSAEEQSSSSSTPSLLTRAKWIDFAIADGRLLAKVLRYGQGRVTSESADAEGNEIRECLELGCEDGHVHLLYSREQAQGEFVLRVVDERGWEVDQRIAATGEQISVRQTERGGLTLSIQNQKQTHSFRGATVWHLLLGESEPCREALVRILGTIRPDWNLAANLNDIRSELVTASKPDQPHAEWSKLVAQLSAEDFSLRQEADRALRASGRPVLVYLSRLNQADLDAEQRLRIRGILGGMATERDDNAQMAADLVRDDVGVWLNLLDTEDQHQQEKALTRVQELVGRTPTINLKAAPMERRAQIATAKERYSEAQLSMYR